jgi:hypothetical protein
MITLAVQDHRACPLRRGGEKLLDAQDSVVVQGIPLRRSAQPKDGHVIVELDPQR